MKVSVIVPIYNAQKYLKRCVDSILLQDCKEMEVLLIDDGSTDESSAICMEYQEKEKRVKVIRQDNSGQSLARNKGLDHATGEYICFVDADDKLRDHAIEKLLKAAADGNYDVVAGGYHRIEGTARPHKVSMSWSDASLARNGTEEEQKHYHAYKTTSMAGYVWGKLYRRQFLQEHALRFDDIRKIFMEDTLFNSKLFSYTPSYYVIQESVYVYYIHPNSFSHGEEVDITHKYIHMLQELETFLEKRRVFDENLDLFAAVAARTFCWSVVKNIPYTGLSFAKIYKEIAIFAQTEYMEKLARKKQTYVVLQHLSGLLERIFYCMCFLLLRCHMSGILAFIFTLTYPLQKKYISNTLK